MPDEHGFDVLPHRGRIVHVCIECGWPEWGVTVSEADRKRHHSGHARTLKQAAEKQRKANLALARKAKQEYQR